MKHQTKRYTLEQLKIAIANSFSIKQVLEKIGLSLTGGNYSHLKKKIKQLGIDSSHFMGQATRKSSERTWGPSNKRDLVDILQKGTTYCSAHLKKRLIKDKLLKEECLECELGFEWKGKFLSLHLDHKNGDRTDNRLENLRLLCPNCHSQTDTYAGKKRSSSSPIGSRRMT